MTIHHTPFTKWLKVFVLLCAADGVVVGQGPWLETNPASSRFYQIRTPHFRVIFQKEFEKEARRTAATLEAIQGPEAASLRDSGFHRPMRPFPVILQNLSARSNAFVTLAPRRSEFYGMPPQDNMFTGTNDWLNTIAVHEYRHMAQFERAATGMNKLLYYVFGQNIMAVTSFLSAPQWFWEGDAVVTETAFTRSGRGRIPNFDLAFRVNLLEGRTFNYHKQYLRSYKHFIPDHYVLGYHMMTYFRETNTNPGSVGRLAGRAWAHSLFPFTFSNSMKKESGKHVTEMFDTMAAAYADRWKEQLAELDLTPFEVLSVRKNEAFTEYEFPQALPGGQVVAVKSGIGDIATLVLLKDSAEKKLHVLGPVNSAAMLSANAHGVVWNEFTFDPRWKTRSYSEVRLLDFGSGKVRMLGKKGRYAGASLSPDGLLVASVETTAGYETALVLLNAKDGTAVRKFPNMDNAHVAMPRWDAEGKALVYIKTTAAGRSVERVTIASGQVDELIAPSDENIGYPVVHDGYLLYNSPFSGIDNIYALELSTGRRFQITSARYGAYNPCPGADGYLYYNDRGRNGMDVVRVRMDPSAWKPVAQVEDRSLRLYQPALDQEAMPDILDKVTEGNYPVTRYSKANGLINIHSWGPYFTGDLENVNIGIYSQNLLSTLALDAGYQFDLTERTGFWNGTLSYQGWYPIVDFGFDAGKRTQSQEYTDGNGNVQTVDFDWDETGVDAGLRIPLVLTQSKYNRVLEFEYRVGYGQVSSFVNSVDGGGRQVPVTDSTSILFFTVQDNGSLLLGEFNLSFTNLLKRSTRDFYPKFGQQLYFSSSATFAGSDFTGAYTALTGYAFFPGLLKHHSLWLIGAYQNTLITIEDDNYWYRNQIPRPRGFSYPTDEDFYFGSVNYAFPLWYPDIALGPLLNIKRIKANLFYDSGFGTTYVTRQQGNQLIGIDRQRYYTSVGAEIRFDFNFMRLLQELELGVRFVYAVQTESPQVQLIIGDLGF
jgi:hypothetical protein